MSDGGSAIESRDMRLMPCPRPTVHQGTGPCMFRGLPP
jgi:hypothetical protein